MKKKTKWGLIRLALFICVAGIVLQTQIINAKILDVKYVGQAYLAIGATVLGNATASMIDFTHCKIPYIKRTNMFFYAVFAIVAILISVIWFSRYLGNDVAGGIATTAIGLAISACYECANQFDEKKYHTD